MAMATNALDIVHGFMLLSFMINFSKPNKP